MVYITLPGQTEAVVAGRYRLQPSRRGDSEGIFVYGRSYLERLNAVPLDPIDLKLSTRTYRTMAMGGLFGALRDASPDYWGRLVIQRYLGLAQPDELDYLLHSQDDRAGALGFGLSPQPPAPRRLFNQTLDLRTLQATADVLLREKASDVPAAEQIEKLLLLGTSMGGARPKAVIEDETGLWIAKFNRLDDAWNNARVEHAMLLLARACGITTADSQVVVVGNRDVLLVRRFDREKSATGYFRARMISALTLLRAEDNVRGRDKWSYVLLAEELRRACTHPARQTHELFRRMVFNALISNLDDHPRNHALIAPGEEWRLSPAYDLTPSTPISLERRDLAMACGDSGRFANAGNLLSQCGRFLLDSEPARAILDELEAIIRSQWYAIARGAGVSERDCGKIASAFVYPGFRQPQQEQTF